MSRKKKEAIQKGTVTEQDMTGNCQADELAKAGANMHESLGTLGLQAQDRRVLACMTQKMQLHIWEAYLEASDDAMREAASIDAQDIADLHVAQHNCEDMYDYNPFEEEREDVNTHEQNEGLRIKPKQQIADIFAALPHRDKFPDYGWREHSGTADPQFQIHFPDAKAMRNLYQGQKQHISKLSSPYVEDAQKGTVQKQHATFHIPAHWWEPLAWWCCHTVWTRHGIAYAKDSRYKNAMRVTWVELCIAFQLQTNFRYTSAALDLRSQEKVFRTMFTRLLKMAITTQNGKPMTYEQAWSPATSISSAKAITGHPRAGCCRRPVLDNAIWEKVIDMLMTAMKTGNNSDTFGSGTRVTIPRTTTCAYTPSAIVKLYNDRPDELARDFPSSASTVVTVSQVTVSDGKGPCYFGHTTTSGRRRGKVLWYSNPIISYWPGKVPGGVVLCSKCYQAANRAVAKGKVPKLPASEDCRDFAECPPPGTAAADCIKPLVMINKALGGVGGVCSLALRLLVRWC